MRAGGLQQVRWGGKSGTARKERDKDNEGEERRGLKQKGRKRQGQGNNEGEKRQGRKETGEKRQEWMKNEGGGLAAGVVRRRAEARAPCPVGK